MPHKRTIYSPRPDFRCRLAVIVLLCLLSCKVAFADITPDGTLGTDVSQAGVDFTITGGTERGTNLFHSFSIFDINTGETASFQGPASIANILSRVTGGATSNIDGTLRSGIPGAAFYLINPAGVIFGPNATLDVQGAFHVSTADYVVLGNDGRFDVSDPYNSVLTTAPPSAFGFLDNTPAPLTFNGGFLQVPDGETLSVIGGDITINDATLYASEGRINLASVASAGEVRPTMTGLDTSDFAELGNIEVTHSKGIFDRPRDGVFFLANIDVSGEGGGSIYIRGGRFVSDNGAVFSDTRGSGIAGRIDIRLDDELRLSNEGRITAEALAGGPGGDIDIEAKKVVLESGGVVSVETFNTGPGGAINITTGSASLTGRAIISVSTRREGDAGSLLIDAEQLDISDGAAIISNSRGAGNGGDIAINVTGTLNVSGAVPKDDSANSFDESAIATNAFGSGNGGTITITAGDVRVEERGLIQANLENKPFGDQPPPGPDTHAGEISIQADNIALIGGGQVVSGNLTEGQGGNILVTVTDTTQISGSSRDGTQASGLFSVTAGNGSAGSVELNTTVLHMEDLGAINTATIGTGQAGNILVGADNVALMSGARISSSTSGAGAGGQVTVVALEDIAASGQGSDGFGSGFYSDVQVSAGGQAADASGEGGNISLTARNITLTDHGTISAKSDGAGNAGTINLQAENTLQLQNNASVTTGSLDAGGGKINISAREMVYLLNSKITSSVADGSGNGGDITIDPVFVILNNSQIIAQAFAGAGGNINISTDFFIASEGSIIDASSQLGVDGQVIITAANTDLSSSLVELPIAYQDATSLLQERCVARTAESAGSLVVTGPGGVPPAPDELLYASPFLPASLNGNQAAVDEKVARKSVPAAIRINVAGEPALLLGCSR